MPFNLRHAAFAAAVGFCALSGAAMAETFKLTAGASHPPIVPWVGVMKDHIVPEAVKRAKAVGHEIRWTEAYAGALFNAANALEGVESGLADLAWVGTIFEPSKLPLHNVQFYAPFATGDVRIVTEVGRQLHERIPELHQQWAKYKNIYLGAHGDGSYHLVTKFPVTKLEDLKGKKLLAGGPVARWLENTGAIVIASSYPEFYTSLQTGVADGAVMTITGILPFKIHEVAPYVTLADLGAPITGALTMNKRTFDSLPPPMQQIFRDLGKDYSRMVADKVADNEKNFLVILNKQGAKISTLAPSERTRWVEGLPDIASEWVMRNEAPGMPAGNVMRTFMELVRAHGGQPTRAWGKDLKK